MDLENICNSQASLYFSLNRVIFALYQIWETHCNYNINSRGVHDLYHFTLNTALAQTKEARVEGEGEIEQSARLWLPSDS